jgi:hypothetical protein
MAWPSTSDLMADANSEIIAERPIKPTPEEPFVEANENSLTNGSNKSREGDA